MSYEVNEPNYEQGTGGPFGGENPVPEPGQQPVNLVGLLPSELVPILEKEREFLEKSRPELKDLLGQGIDVENKILTDWGAASELAPANPSLDEYSADAIDCAKEWLSQKRESKQKELKALEEEKAEVESRIKIWGDLAKNQTTKINNLIASLKALPKQRNDAEQLIERLEKELEEAADDLVEAIQEELDKVKKALEDLDMDEQNLNTKIQESLADWRKHRATLRALIESDGGLQKLAFEINKVNKDLEYMGEKKYENAIIKKYLGGPNPC